MKRVIPIILALLLPGLASAAQHVTVPAAYPDELVGASAYLKADGNAITDGTDVQCQWRRWDSAASADDGDYWNGTSYQDTDPGWLTSCDHLNGGFYADATGAGPWSSRGANAEWVTALVRAHDGVSLTGYEAQVIYYLDPETVLNSICQATGRHFTVSGTPTDTEFDTTGLPTMPDNSLQGHLKAYGWLQYANGYVEGFRVADFADINDHITLSTALTNGAPASGDEGCLSIGINPQ